MLRVVSRSILGTWIPRNWLDETSLVRDRLRGLESQLVERSGSWDRFQSECQTIRKEIEVLSSAHIVEGHPPKYQEEISKELRVRAGRIEEVGEVVFKNE